MNGEETGLELGRLRSALVQSVAQLRALLVTAQGEAPCVRDGPPPYALDAAEDRQTYQIWLEARAGREAEAQRRRTAQLASSPGAPTISVILAVTGSGVDDLQRSVDSVIAQDAGTWELCVGHSSADLAVDALVSEYVAAHAQVKATAVLPPVDFVDLANETVSLATGDFLALLGQGDEIAGGALTAVALALCEDRDVDVLYTDEDVREPDGTLAEPFFKPGWDPDQLLSHMYMGSLFVVRRAVFERLEGLRAGPPGAVLYDLALRSTEEARKVAHLPVVAYHRRRTPDGDDPADRAGTRAAAVITDALRRRGEDGLVEPGLVPGTWRVRRAIGGSPRVSVIIPFHNGAELLRRCVDSLTERSGYDRWEAILVDNRSWEPETRALTKRFAHDARLRLLSYPGEFNWAEINNHAVQQSEGEHLVFLNADVEGVSDGWLVAMLEHSQRLEVGPVGARLSYPDGRVQHAGVVMGLGGGIAWHAFCSCPPDKTGYRNQGAVVRNCSAVTGACMMVRREVFEELDGFDDDLPVAYNDIDFCLRAGERGYRVVYTPFAELAHEESSVRGIGSWEPTATKIMWERWQSVIRRDPFFNPNLDPRHPEFVLPSGLEVVDPWESLASSVETLSTVSGPE